MTICTELQSGQYRTGERPTVCTVLWQRPHSPWASTVSTTALAVLHLLQRMVSDVDGKDMSVSHWGQSPAEISGRERSEATGIVEAAGAGSGRLAGREIAGEGGDGCAAGLGAEEAVGVVVKGGREGEGAGPAGG
jgi:hypothetical protein